MPRFFGRGHAIDEVRAALGNASEWAGSALVDLDRASIELPDARRAVAMLKSQVDAVRWSEGAARLDHLPEMTAAIDDARRAASSIELVRDGAQAIDGGHASEWIASTVWAGTDSDLQAAKAVAGHPDSGLSPAARAFVDAATAGDQRSLEIAVLAAAKGAPAAASERLSRVLMQASEGAPVDATELRQLLTTLDDGVGDGARRLPDWIHGETGSITLDEIDVAQLWLLRDQPDPASLRSLVLEHGGVPIEANAHDLSYYATIDSLPAGVRPDLPSSIVDGADLADAVRAGDGSTQLAALWARSHAAGGTLANKVADLLVRHADDDRHTAMQLAALAREDAATVYGGLGPSTWRTKHLERLADPVSERQAWLDLQALRMLRGDVAIPDDAVVATMLDSTKQTRANLDQLGPLAQLPTSHRPPSITPHRREVLDAFRVDDLVALDDIAWKRQVAKLKQDPAVGVRVLEADLLRIASKSHEDIQAFDIQRIARIVSAPKSVRPEVPRSMSGYSWQDLAAGPYLPRDDDDAAIEFANLGTFIAARRLDSDASATATQLGARLDEILAKPAEDLTDEDLRFIGALHRMESTKAPRIPDSSDGYGYVHDIAVGVDSRGSFPGDLEAVRVARMAERLAADPATTRAAVTAQLDEALARSEHVVMADDVRFVAALDELPEPLRPALPEPNYESRLELARQVATWGVDEVADSLATEFASLRRARVQQRIQDPSLTREHATAWLDGIISKPDSQIGVDQIHELALLSGLPKARRPEFPKPLEYGWKDLHEWSYVPSDSTVATGEIEHLRRARIQQRLQLDPGFDQTAATTRMREVLDGPQTPEAERELLALLTLPKALRPKVPATTANAVAEARSFLSDLHP